MRGAGRGGAVRRRQAERVALVGVVVALWVPVACGGGGTSDVEDAEVSDGALPGEVCALLGRLEEREEELEGPEVFALDEPELAEVLAERREVLVALAGETGSELGSVLEEWVAAQPAVDEAMLATWNEDRARLAGEHNDVWLDEVVGHDVRRDDGEAIDVPDYWRNVQTGHERLVVGCRAPELADGPEQDTSEDPPPGRLAFYRPPGRAAA